MKICLEAKKNKSRFYFFKFLLFFFLWLFVDNSEDNRRGHSVVTVEGGFNDIVCCEEVYGAWWTPGVFTQPGHLADEITAPIRIIIIIITNGMIFLLQCRLVQGAGDNVQVDLWQWGCFWGNSSARCISHYAKMLLASMLESSLRVKNTVSSSADYCQPLINLEQFMEHRSYRSSLWKIKTK